MTIDWVWLLMGACAIFALGWLSSRIDIQQLRLENQRQPKAFFKGLNFLLNEQQDEAIDAFIQAVQQDPDTSELHFALGNLFRKRGEFERAVRVHQHLLARADLSLKDRHRAMFDLAQDFLRAGILDRAEDSLNSLKGTSLEAQAMLALLNLYERSRDWENAKQVAHRLEELGEGDFSARTAHYLCEQAAQAPDLASNQRLIAQALACAPNSARAKLAMARVMHLLGERRGALEILSALFTQNPRYAGLGAPMIAQIASELNEIPQVQATLLSSYEDKPRLDVLEAIVQLHHTLDPSNPNPSHSEQRLYAAHLARTPSTVAAAKWLQGEPSADTSTHSRVAEILEKSALHLKRYRCAACGFEANNYFWQCPGCQSWDSYPPERIEEL